MTLNSLFLIWFGFVDIAKSSSTTPYPPRPPILYLMPNSDNAFDCLKHLSYKKSRIRIKFSKLLSIHSATIPSLLQCATPEMKIYPDDGT